MQLLLSHQIAIFKKKLEIGMENGSVRNWHIHFIKMIKDPKIISGRIFGGGAAVKFVAFWQLWLLYLAYK